MEFPKKQISWISYNDYKNKITELGKDIEYVSVMGEKNLDSGITKKGLNVIYISKDIPVDPDNKP